MDGPAPTCKNNQYWSDPTVHAAMPLFLGGRGICHANLAQNIINCFITKSPALLCYAVLFSSKH